MCPFCWANVGLVIAGALSTGGLATLVVKVSGKKKRFNRNHFECQSKEQSRCQLIQSTARK
jgi:hypothetical protein